MRWRWKWRHCGWVYLQARYQERGGSVHMMSLSGGGSARSKVGGAGSAREVHNQKENMEHTSNRSVAPVEQCIISNEWKRFEGLGRGPRNMGQRGMGRYTEQGAGAIWWAVWRVKGRHTGCSRRVTSERRGIRGSEGSRRCWECWECL